MPVAKKTTSALTAAQAAPPTSYEAAMQELTQITQTLESGQIPLDDLLHKYQRATFLLQFCQDKLQAVQQQVKVLEQGVLKDWSAS